MKQKFIHPYGWRTNVLKHFELLHRFFFFNFFYFLFFGFLHFLQSFFFHFILLYTPLTIYIIFLIFNECERNAMN